MSWTNAVDAAHLDGGGVAAHASMPPQPQQITTYGLASPEISGWIQVNSHVCCIGPMNEPGRRAREPLAGAGASHTMRTVLRAVVLLHLQRNLQQTRLLSEPVRHRW